MKYLVVRRSDGLVVNAIAWDGISPYHEEGCDLMPLPDDPYGVWIGWRFFDGKWISPENQEEF